MNLQLLQLALDVLLLAGLAAAVFYAVRLSKSMNVFRSFKPEFEKLMRDLGRDILRAQETVENLKEASARSGRDLQGVLDESRALADELRMINETGNNLAKRLEALAERNSKIAKDIEGRQESAPAPDAREIRAAPRKRNPFNIRDPDFDRPDNTLDDAVDVSDDESLQSEAEKEFQAALRRNKGR